MSGQPVIRKITQLYSSSLRTTMRSSDLIRLLLLACFSSAAMTGCDPTPTTADLIMYNGKVITVDDDFLVVQALAVRDGRILAIGDDDDVVKHRDADTKVIDLRGKVVVPGLIEGHAHPVPASQSELTDSIPVVATIAELLHWIRAQSASKPQGEWIIHPKFFITRLSDMRQITLEELDAASPNHPVFLNGSYGGMINSRAFKLSNIDVNDPGILKDDITGKPNGLIRRSAFKLLALPPPDSLSESAKSQALRHLFHRYNSVGFTSVCSGGGNVDELRAFEELRDKNQLTLRVFHNIRLPLERRRSRDKVIGDLKAIGVKTGDGDEWVRVGAFKVILDGGMLTGTAFLHEGWGENAKELYGISDPSYKGELMFTKDELVNIIQAAYQTGWKFTAHVTGGGGVDTLLAAYQMVNREYPIRGRRFSIIHGNFFTDGAIRIMAGLDVYADMQPAWFYEDTDLLERVLGKERLTTFHPYRSLVNAGVVVNAGSDHMVKTDPDLSINPYNPFTAMWSCITRRTKRGTVFGKHQAISRADALKMYTINNAYASFEEDVKGSIEPGKYADLVVLSDDLLTCPADSIRTIRPLLTIVNGEVVYDAKKL